jgi:hypothetical protein
MQPPIEHLSAAPLLLFSHHSPLAFFPDTVGHCTIVCNSHGVGCTPGNVIFNFTFANLEAYGTLGYTYVEDPVTKTVSDGTVLFPLYQPTPPSNPSSYKDSQRRYGARFHPGFCCVRVRVSDGTVRVFALGSAVLGLGSATVRCAFSTEIYTLEDAIGSHAFAPLEALTRV